MKFWAQKGNTTQSGSQLRLSRRSRREKKKQKSTTVVQIRYNILHVSKIAKKSIKANKRRHMNIPATEAEEAAHQGNLRELHTFKKPSGQFGKQETSKGQGRKAYP